MWNCSLRSPTDWQRKLGIVRASAEKAGRDPDDIALSTTVEKALPESDSDSAELLELLSGYQDLGISHFVMDFGNPLDTEPILRFAEQVITPMRTR